MNTENGKFISFISDRYGFNNLDDVYENNNIDILLLGDSFTEGYSVMQKDTIAGVLRKKIQCYFLEKEMLFSSTVCNF